MLDMSKDEKRWEVAGLLLVLALELWLFSGAFQKYFNHDSLFYIIHSPRSWADCRAVLTAPDPGQQYRPLTLIAMGGIVPLLGLNPHPYHWIPLVFHLLNTLLFSLLVRRLLRTTPAVVAATAFWGLHSVAGWITYDVTCISDFLLAFLYLCSLLCAMESTRRRRPILMAASLIFFILSLLTKEVAVTFPLALFVTLVLAGTSELEASSGKADLRRAVRSALPATLVFLTVAVAHALLLTRWLRSGMLYQSGTQGEYEINPWMNLAGKARYLFWALNLPEALHTQHGSRDRLFGIGAMCLILAAWLVTVAKRKGKISLVEWGGLIWFCGLNIPALMLSHRLAKWYLYESLFGFALTFGVAVQQLPACFPSLRARSLRIAIPAIVVVAMVISTVPQTKSYLAASDAAYDSDTLRSCLEEFRDLFPSLPQRADILVLPSFDKDVLRLLSAPPIERGQLFSLYYPHTRLRMLFAHRGESFSLEDMQRPEFRALYLLDGRFYDLTTKLRGMGKVSLFVLPTSEGKIPPLLEQEPLGGRESHQAYVDILTGDTGARLPEGYRWRDDLWILQYLNGHFDDVTVYYKGRRLNHSRRLADRIETIRSSVNREEYYPNYERFATPSGGPIFFPTPDKDILTQIGGSTAFVPAPAIPPDSVLRFDISMMYDLGDGAWAELRVRTRKEEVTLYREYLTPNPKGRGLRWKEVSLNLRAFANQDAEIVLRCYNEKGKSTIADWLNWRGLAIESLESVRETAARSEAY